MKNIDLGTPEQDAQNRKFMADQHKQRQRNKLTGHPLYSLGRKLSSSLVKDKIFSNFILLFFTALLFSLFSYLEIYFHLENIFIKFGAGVLAFLIYLMFRLWSVHVYKRWLNFK